MTAPITHTLASRKLRLIKAQSRQAQRVPFMAPLLYQLTFVPTERIPTFASTEDCTTYYNPEYMDGLSNDNLDKVLYHEALHLFLDYFGRRDDRENLRWNIAHDYEIANIVKPDGCITPEQKNLPPGKIAEWYYTQVPKSPPEGGVGVCGHGSLPDALKKALSQGTQNAIMEAADRICDNKGAGIDPGLYKRALELARPAAGNDVLRRLQGALLTAGDSDFSYGRWNKRNTSDVQTPALVHYEAKVIVILDVSGSMNGRTKPAAEALLGAVKCVGTGLDVIAWDTQVQAVANVRTNADLARIHYSGGGTDMSAAIKYAVTKGRYDAIFVITDCDTPWPDSPKRLPPIYVLSVIPKPMGVPTWMRVLEMA